MFITVASLVVCVLILSLIYFRVSYKTKKHKLSDKGLNFKEPFYSASYNMLLKATNGFAIENLLGAGHYGSVYKGVFDQDNVAIDVAIKVIKFDQKGASKSFMRECEVLKDIRHRNILKIETVCSSIDFQGNDFKALVYEFMANGNLQEWLCIDQHERTLTFLQRVNIAIDVACALDYLHNSCNVPILHCDLKPSNILLDNDLVAHVGDFGLARSHMHVNANYNSISSSVAIKGTVGYAAPEYGLGSMISKEGDIYSYGIILLEMMTAKNPTDKMFVEGLDLHKYAKSAIVSDDQCTSIIDPRLLHDNTGVKDRNEDENFAVLAVKCKVKCIMSLLEIGVKCSVESPQCRMRIEDATRELLLTRNILLEELR